MEKTNVKEELIQAFKKDERINSDKEKIIFGKAIDLVLNNDSKIINLLFKNKKLKTHFFEKINDGEECAYIFKKDACVEFIKNKEMLADSYTAFSSKIGLSVDGELMHKNKDVVLVWPYKDCVLVGGMTKEDQKRDEIFYNKTLAPDEVTKLLEPKVFTNFKKYDKDGEHKVNKIEFTDNLIIRGNNLLALHSLLKKYHGRIKLIYIDPVYNTGNDSFGYNDRFSHSSWLTFNKNRFESCYDLLDEDGIIFVSIDSSRQNSRGIIGSSEQPYLQILMNEVFGRENFVAHLHWKKKKQPSFLSKVAGITESILVYAKNYEKINNLSIEKISGDDKPLINDSNKYITLEFPPGIKTKVEGKKIKKDVIKIRTMKIEYLDDIDIGEDGRTKNKFRAKAKFRNSQESLNEYVKKDLIFITKNFGLRRDVTEEEKQKQKPITDLLLDWGQNQDGDKETREIFGREVFKNAKPEKLIMNIIKASTKKGDLVMDFYLGSGTTCSVAHKMERIYIGIEQMEASAELTKERLKSVIYGDDVGISKEVNWKGGGSFIYCELAKWNETWIEKIQQAKTSEELIKIWGELQDKAFLSYKIDIKTVNENISEFSQLSIEEQKRFLMETLDMNQLYVNLSEIDDEEYGISKEDKELNKQFQKGV